MYFMQTGVFERCMDRLNYLTRSRVAGYNYTLAKHIVSVTLQEQYCNKTYIPIPDIGSNTHCPGVESRETNSVYTLGFGVARPEHSV